MHHYQQAVDLLYGFQIGNESQRSYMADLITNGHVSEDNMKALTLHSLRRNFEEFVMLVSCADSMREKASFGNPLDGRDTLTFITKILQLPHSSGEPSGDEAQTFPQHEEVPIKKPNSGRNKTGPGQLLKKRGKDNLSPFWATPRSTPQALAELFEDRPEDDQKKRKKQEKQKGKNERKEKKAKMRKEAKAQKAKGDENLDSYSQKLPIRPVLEALQHQGNEAVDNPAISLKRRHSQVARRLPEKTSTVSENQGKTNTLIQAQNQTPKRAAKSPYFSPYFDMEETSPTKVRVPRPPRGTIPCIPFPRLDAPKFGLIQEDLASDPFRLLVAVTFLIRVKGKLALPAFHQLMSRYPTPKSLAEANTEDIISMIKHLGLVTVRAAAIQKYARTWIDNPPKADVRYEVKNYPGPTDRTDSRLDEYEPLISDSSRLPAWEIGHMTQGRYAIDSWRIFCRDVLLGRAEDWRGKGREGEFQPEWMRVLPEDKELRACLRWLWMQEGWAWDPRTGDREILPENLRKAVDEGRVTYDDTGGLKILDKENLSSSQPSYE
ncbi:DNA glycosylase [Rostrohypoxylon terebratum]|nr:DNA glycosylase [Rostrohypoxylon terebratum]